MPTTTVKCESWCVDHASEDGETCSTAPILFGPRIGVDPRSNYGDRACELFTYRLNEDPTCISIFAQGGGRQGTPIDEDALRHIHAALQLDAEGFADAVATMVKALDS